MPRKHLVALVLAATTLAASGCGESSKSTELTQAELIAKADAICTHLHIQFHEHGIKTDQDFARYVPLLGVHEQAATAQLRKLVPPNSMASDWKRILDGTQTAANDTTKLGQYAKEHSSQPTASLLATGQQAQQEVAAIAQRDGFKDCARTN